MPLPRPRPSGGRPKKTPRRQKLTFIAKGPMMELFLRPSSAGPEAVAVAVSSRLVKHAVRRNRIRRIIKEWLRVNKKYHDDTKRGILVVLKKACEPTRQGSKMLRDELSVLAKTLLQKRAQR